MQSTEERLASLEKSAWRWRSVAVVLMVGMAMRVVLGAEKVETPKPFICSGLTVTDKDGVPGIVMKCDKDGDTISLQGPAKGMIAICTGDDGGTINIAVVDKEVKDRLWIAGTNKGGSVEVFDGKGKSVQKLP